MRSITWRTNIYVFLKKIRKTNVIFSLYQLPVLKIVLVTEYIFFTTLTASTQVCYQ